MERMWYYMHENSQKGPVSQDELTQLVQQGLIQKDTYVWTEGMADWQPIGAVNMAVQMPQLQPQRPTAVTVFGVINIIFGILGLVCVPVGIAAILIPKPAGMPVTSLPMQGFTLFSSGLSFILSIVLLAAGIGLLNLKRWARQTSYFYGWFTLVWGVLSTIITLGLTFSQMSGAQGPESAGMIGGMVGGICGGVIGLIYPIFLIVYMRKPAIVEACNR